MSPNKVLTPTSKIYIAGHTGLIGSACARYLRSKGYNNVITRLRQDLNLTDTCSVNNFFKTEKPEFVILAAGVVGGIEFNIKRPAQLMLENLSIQSNVMSAARNINCQKVIIFGSSCMYPKFCAQPMQEKQLFTGALEATSRSYAIAKFSAVQLALACNSEDSCDRFIPLIPNSVFGPNDNFNPDTGHVLSALIARFSNALSTQAESIELWGSGQARREFVFSRDVARACLQLISLKSLAVDGPINVGCGYDMSIKELAQNIAAHIGYSGHILWDTTKPEGTMQKLLDSTVINHLGWLPKTSFNEGLKETVRWYQQNRLQSS